MQSGEWPIGSLSNENRNEPAPPQIGVELLLVDEREPGSDLPWLRPLQGAIEASYQALSGSDRTQVQPVAILDELEERRVKVRFRTDLESGRVAESGQFLSRFLSRGTLAMITWMDESPTLRLADLQQALRVLSAGTSATESIGHAAPDSASLLAAITAWQSAKEALAGCESVRISFQHGAAELNLAKRIDDPSTLLVSKKVAAVSEMILVVEQPDFGATGEWKFKHRDTHITTTCEPGTLLSGYYQREVDIRPGDALHCRVETETFYGPDHDVLTQRFKILEVLEILPTGQSADSSGKPDAETAEEVELSDESLTQFQGDFGVLSLRRVPIG
ncbi:MAG TPA: hypothetical protein VFK19_07090 [Sphingomicrobium sp.]|nr:hypothetical protein [Sphingomicrobium sp.]